MWGGVNDDSLPKNQLESSPTDHQNALERAKERIGKLKRERQETSKYTVDIQDPLNPEERRASGASSKSIKQPNVQPNIQSDFYQGKQPPTPAFNLMYHVPPPPSALEANIPEKYARRTGNFQNPNSPALRPTYPIAGKPWRNLSRANLLNQSVDEFNSSKAVLSPSALAKSVAQIPSSSFLAASPVGFESAQFQSPQKENSDQSPLIKSPKSLGNLTLYQRRSMHTGLNDSDFLLGSNSAYSHAVSTRHLNGNNNSNTLYRSALTLSPSAQPQSSALSPNSARQKNAWSSLKLQDIDKQIEESSAAEVTVLQKWNDVDLLCKEFRVSQYITPLKFAQSENRFWAKRRPELEGIFVGNAPYISAENLLKIEARLRLEATSRNSLTVRLIDADGQVARQRNYFAIAARKFQLYLYPESTQYTIDFDQIRGTNPIPAIDAAYDNTLMLLKPIMWNDFGVKRSLSYELCVQLDKVQLLDHPLMNEENRLALNLQTTISTIQDRLKTGKVDFENRKLEGLRTYFKQQKRLYKQYKQQLDQEKQSAGPSPEQETLSQAQTHWKQIELQETRLRHMQNRLAQIITQINQSRQLLQTEMQTDRLLEFKTIQVWQKLKKLRIEQGYTSTPHILLIKYIPTDRREDVDFRKQKIKEELQDSLQQWKLEKQLKKRLFFSSSRAETLTDSYEMTETFDQEACKLAIKKRLELCYRELGSPELHFELSLTEAVSEMSSCTLAEQQRRNKLSSKFFYMQLSYNDRPITQTALARLDFSTFTCQLGLSNKFGDNSLRLKVSEEPYSFSIALREVDVSALSDRQNSFAPDDAFLLNNSKPLCTSYAPIPPSFKIESTKDSKPECLDFSSNDATISGQIWLGLAWGVDSNGQSLGPSLKDTSALTTVNSHIGNVSNSTVSHFYDPMASFGKTGTLNIRQMLEWLRSAPIDPNNPLDASLIQLKRIGVRAQEALLDSKMISPEKNAAIDDGGVDKVMALSFSAENRFAIQRIFRFKIPIRILNEALGLAALAADGSDAVRSRRQVLLRARFDEEVSMHGPVPLQENEIVDSTFDRITDTSKLESLEKWLHGGRVPYLGFLKRVRAHALIIEAKKNRLPQHRDIIREESIVLDPNQESIFAKLFSVQRPLKPRRQSRTHTATSEFAGVLRNNRCKLAVQIGSAVNIPLRKLNPMYNDWSAQQVAMRQKLANVSPFVEVQFLQWRMRTSVQSGTNPVWNETLEIPLHECFGDNWTVESLLESSLLSENIFIHVYDQILTDMNIDSRLNNHAHFRWEPVWLGSVTIPFSAIYERSKISGLFQIQTPFIFVGYDKTSNAVPATLAQSVVNNRSIISAGGDLVIDGEHSETSAHSANEGTLVISKTFEHATGRVESLINGQKLNDELVIKLESVRETMIDLFITLEPPLPLPAEVKLPYTPNETREVLQAASLWENANDHRGRFWKALVVSMSGETRLVSSFIEILPLPPGLATIEQLSRFVSLIPCIPRAAVLGGQADIWCKSHQVFDLGAADYDEHAILLCSYLKSIGRTSYVVLGYGIPEGRTAYTALVFNDEVNGTKQVTLINPVTGKFYSPRDSHCLLKEVGCMFDDCNVYGNIQQHTAPARIEWDVQDTRNWKPVFTGANIYMKPALFGSLPTLNQTIVYPPVRQSYLKDLERSIEKAVVKSVESWRPRLPTKWSRIGSRLFSTVISKLEEFVKNNIEIPAEQLLETMPEWRSVNTMYQVCGFPLNFAYTDIPSILSMVNSTSLYNNENENVEFALAVSAYGYTEKITSVWVWIATFTRKSL